MGYYFSLLIQFYLIRLFKVVRFCLKLNISENTDPKWMYLSGKLTICLGMILGYFLELIRPPEIKLKSLSAPCSKVLF